LSLLLEFELSREELDFFVELFVLGGGESDSLFVRLALDMHEIVFELLHTDTADLVALGRHRLKNLGGSRRDLFHLLLLFGDLFLVLFSFVDCCFVVTRVLEDGYAFRSIRINERDIKLRSTLPGIRSTEVTV